MKTSQLFILSVAMGSIVLAAPFAWADGHGSCYGAKSRMMSRHGGGHGHVTSHLLRHLLKDKGELGLSEDQVAKLRQTALDADRARIRGIADEKISERELRSLIWDEKADLGAIWAKIKEKASFEAAVQMIGIKEKRDLLSVLTEDQKNKWKTLWEQRRSQSQSHRMRAETDEAATGPSASLDFSDLDMHESATDRSDG